MLCLVLLPGERDDGDAVDELLVGGIEADGDETVVADVDVFVAHGNMAEAFDNYIAAIHDRQAMVAEGRATLAGTKAQVTIMCIVPFVFSAFLKVSDPTYFDAAYNWLGGFGRYIIIMLYGIVVAGFFMLRKMCDIRI